MGAERAEEERQESGGDLRLRGVPDRCVARLIVRDLVELRRVLGEGLLTELRLLGLAELLLRVLRLLLTDGNRRSIAHHQVTFRSILC